MHKKIQELTFIHGLYRYNFILLSTLLVMNKTYQNLILKKVGTILFNVVYKHRYVL
jgi:hypothetical protein